MQIISVLTLSILLFSGAALSNDHEDSLKEIDMVLQALLELFPGATDYTLDDSVVDGLYAVSIGSEVIYVSKDGKFLIRGEIYDLQNSVNVTEEKRVLGRLDVMQSLDEQTMIIYEPEKTKHTITIFTDIDCGYCRKLHSEITNYLENGIQVNYLAYPREGLESDTYQKMKTAWCSKDPQVSLTTLKLGKTIKSDDCTKKIVSKHYNLAKEFNARGTPTIILENGFLLAGYHSAEEILNFLEK